MRALVDGALCRVLQDRAEHDEAIPGDLWWGLQLLLKNYEEQMSDACTNSLSDVSRFIDGCGRTGSER